MKGSKTGTELAPQFSNHLKSLRTQKGLSQGQLANQTGITRQAVSAIESNLYLPTTAVALRLASVLACHVEDLFSLVPTEDIIEGTLIGHLPQAETRAQPIRVKVSTVGKRTVVRPVTDLGEQLSFAVPADGYVTETYSKRSGNTIRVKLSRDREAIQQEISVAGCDPAIFLVGEHIRRQKDQTTVVGWTMGSMAALQALQRGEVHVAGMHLFDPVTGESNMPFLRRSLKGSGYDVVTFATWEEGFLVRPGNPKSIRTAADLAEPMVTLVNREEGSGARLLLDQRLRAAGSSADDKFKGMTESCHPISKWPEPSRNARQTLELEFDLRHNCSTWISYRYRQRVMTLWCLSRISSRIPPSPICSKRLSAVHSETRSKPSAGTTRVKREKPMPCGPAEGEPREGCDPVMKRDGKEQTPRYPEHRGHRYRDNVCNRHGSG